MPTRCQDCNASFLLDGTTVVNGISCPDCGSTKLERDQPSPTHSDGEVRNMVDPATQLDQGGNPLQEGVWAGVDGGWQPEYRRDETFAKVADMHLPPSGIEPQYHGTAQPMEPVGLHNGNLHWLHFLDASINGKPVREHHHDLWMEHGFSGRGSWLQPVTVSVHHPDHLAAAIEAVQTPQLIGDKRSLVHAPTLAATGKAIFAGQIPPPPGINVQPPIQQAPVMSNHYDRSLSQEPYLPWYHQADVQRYPGDGGAPVSLTNEEWATDRKQRYQDRQDARGGHHLGWKPGQAGRGIMIGSQLHTWPVEKTMENPQGGDMHGEYLSKLGVNPANVDVRSGFEINPDGTVVGGLPPQAAQIDPNLREGQEEWGQAFGATKTSIAPLLALGGRLLLGQALGGLMKKAIGGANNFLNTGGPGEGQPESQPVSLVASEHVGVGHDAPVESPGSTPRIVEDHDPESVDQQEFNDGDTSPAFNNPNKDDADAGLSQSTGEDGVNQKLEFRHDGDAVNQAEMLLPLLLEFINSEKSGLEHPQIKALHEALEQEIPGYLDHADENDESVQKLLEELRKPEGVTAATHQGSPVFQNTPMAPGQMQMGNQQIPMPGTFQNPVQPGGMPVSGKCMNCGGVLNADGSCPQCGAAAGANQQGNLQAAPGGQAVNPPGFMRPAMGHTAADHQGPITPQQKEVFAQYLIDQGRNDEVAAMMTNPALYADEWAQYINKSTQPPEVDPAEQAPMPQVPPEQMGQMPVPPMNIPQPTAAKTNPSSDTNPRRCPRCSSATTSLMNGEGDIRCHRCGNVWSVDVTEDAPVVSKRSWIVKSYTDALNDAPNPVAAPAADATAPGDHEQQQDSTLSWQSADGTPLQVGQTYEMHNPGYAIPDVVKVEQVKPDSIVVTMEGEYNSPSDPQDANGPGYTHEINLQEAQTEGLTFNPVQDEGDQEQSQDQNDKDGIGQTVNTEPVEQPHGDFPVHSNRQVVSIGGAMVNEDPRGQFHVGQEVNYQALGGRTERGFVVGFQPALAMDPFIQNQSGQTKVISRQDIQGDPIQIAAKVELPTDHCPKCEYGHVTSSYNSPTEIQYECFRCAHQWKVAELDEDSELNPESRAWIQEDGDSDPIGFDPRALAMASSGQGRNIHDIAKRDPRNAEIHERLNKNAGAKFSPREQKEFIDEEGVARNADRLNLDGTHYESAFDNSKARPDRVNDNYLGLGL